MSALNVSTAALINIPGRVDQKIIPDVGEILQTATTAQHHVIVLDRAHGLIRRSARKMDKVFRARSNRHRTMGRSGCNSCPIPPRPEARQPIDEAIIATVGIIVEATCGTTTRICQQRIGSRKEKSMALLAPVPARLAKTDNLVHQRVFTTVGIIVKGAC
jgi:hypothetical protein